MTDVEFLLDCYIQSNLPFRSKESKYSLECKKCNQSVTFASHEIIVEKCKDGTIYDGIVHDDDCRWNEAKQRLRKIRDA